MPAHPGSRAFGCFRKTTSLKSFTRFAGNKKATLPGSVASITGALLLRGRSSLCTRSSGRLRRRGLLFFLFDRTDLHRRHDFFELLEVLVAINVFHASIRLRRQCVHVKRELVASA